MKREQRNLDESPDFVLGPEPMTMTRYWLRGGPSDGTMVEVPVGTENVFAVEPAVEVALTPIACSPRVAVYEIDQNMRGGGFNVFRYVRSDFVLSDGSVRAPR